MTCSSTAIRISLILGSVAVTQHMSWGEDWPRFRGDNGSGVSTSHSLPVEFGPAKKLVWKIDASHGSSSPIVSKGLLFFTSYKGDERTLHCLDAATGKERWSRSVKKSRQENATPPNDPATPTPATDGESVYVLYPDVGVLCYSTSGDEKWRAELEPFRSMHGIASSLVTVDNLVIVVADQLAGSYIEALHADTGKVAWRSSRADGVAGAWSTPAVYRPKKGPSQLVVTGPIEIVGYEAASGKRLWWVTGITNAPISVPVILGDRLFVCEAAGERLPFSLMASFDKNKDGKITVDEVKSNIAMQRLVERIDAGWGNHKGEITSVEWDKAWGTLMSKAGLVAIDLGGSGDVTKTSVRWANNKGVPSIPSALLYDGLIYTVKDGGIFSAFEAETGKLIKQARLQPGGKQFYVSPVAADGLIYVVDTEGKVTVIKAGRDWKQLKTNELGEPCFATPAIADGRVYVRTSKSLYCFGA
jgi:outer membrane protein assembly factor BamB